MRLFAAAKPPDEGQAVFRGKAGYRPPSGLLTGKTNSGITTFRNIISRAARLLRDQPYVAAEIPIRGARRVIIDGWYFDYDIIDGAIWIQRITSSINTPSLTYDDDADYEN